MNIATIFKSRCKVRLHYFEENRLLDHTITIAYGDRISITLSEDEDMWLITVHGQDRFCNEVTICLIFADCIEKGNY